MMDSERWLRAWRGLALGFLREGYYSADAVLHWAKENGFSLWMVKQALEALAVEQFDHNGERYWRLSGKVVPILPREVREAAAYRQAGGAARNSSC